MNWDEVEKEINKVGFLIVETEIKHMGNKIRDFNVEFKGKTFGDRYLIHLENGTLDQLDDQYLLFDNLAKIRYICSILNDWYKQNKETLLKEYLK